MILKVKHPGLREALLFGLVNSVFWVLSWWRDPGWLAVMALDRPFGSGRCLRAGGFHRSAGPCRSVGSLRRVHRFGLV